MPVADLEVFLVSPKATPFRPGMIAPPPTPPPPGYEGRGLIDCAMIFGADPMPMSMEEHEDDVHRFGASIADSLKREMVALRHAQTELAKANAKAASSAQALAAVYGPEVASGKEDPIIELSVRGNRTTKMITTLRSTILTCPEDSQLAVRFTRWLNNDIDKDAYGRWQINDCSPAVFSKILDVLRMKKRAGWDGRDSPEGRGCCRLVRVAVKESDRSAFETLVNMYFPGCECFILDAVEFQVEWPSP